MHEESQNVFTTTKILYDEMYQYFQANYIGEQQKLDRFVEQNIEPLYPSKPVDDLNGLRDSDIITKAPNKPHRYTHLNRKTSLGQFTEFQLDTPTETQVSDKSRVIYTNVIRRYKLKQLCFSLGTGNFFCWRTSPPDKVYEDMGLSTCLYLKFVKHLIYSLLLISPLIIFMLVTFYLTAIDNDISPGTNYKKFIFSFSIGTLSLQQINCKQHKLPSNLSTISGNLFCSVGNVKILGPIYTESLFESLQNCRVDMDNFINKQKQFMEPSSYQQMTDCDSNSSICSYSIALINKNREFNKISITYECVNGELDLGALKIKRNSLFYITVAFDLTSIIIMCLFLWSQIVAETQEQRNFKDKQFLLNAFSFQAGPFSINNFQEELVDFLQFIEGKYNKFYRISIKKIVQIRPPDDPQFISHQERRRIAYKKLYDLIGQTFIKRNFNPYLYLDQKDFMWNCFQNKKSYEMYDRQLTKLVTQYKKCQRLRKLNFNGTMFVYFVFEKPKYKRIIVQNSNMGKIKINNKEYEIRDITSPQLMLWQNIFKLKLPRILVSYAITFLTWFGSYVLLAFIWSLRKFPMKSYNFDVDCTSLYQNQNLNIYNQELRNSDDTATYMHCYCSNNSFLSINSQQLCKDWSARYFEYLIVPLFFSVTIIGLNIVLSLFYKKLSLFEAYHKVTSQLYSYILKKTLLLILLLSMVIISLSFEQHQQTNIFEFLYEGTYKDITVDWYQQIGSIIIITLCFNIITPLIQVLTYFGKRVYVNIRISLFKKSSNYKKLKRTYMSFYKTDVFPIEQRYAEILAVSAICFSLSCVCPSTIIILIVELTFFAMIDKILIIKAYHKPINFQEKLHKKVIYSFFIIVLCHLLVTAILLTQKYILIAGQNLDNSSIVDQNKGRIQAIFSTNYIIPYMILFFLLLVSLASVAVSRLFYFSKPNKKLNIGKDGVPFEEHRYYNLLNSIQLNKTIKLKQKEWHRIKIMLDNYFYHGSYKPSSTPSSDSQLNTADRMLILPESASFLPESSRYLQLSYVQRQPQQQQLFGQQNRSISHQRQMIAQTSMSKGSILKKVTKYCFYKLMSKKQKNEKDKMRMTRLMGMSTYDHYDDWIFLEDHVKVDFKIEGL